MTDELTWAECPTCGKTVFVVRGVVGNHIKPPHARRWPKLPEECPQGGESLVVA